MICNKFVFSVLQAAAFAIAEVDSKIRIGIVGGGIGGTSCAYFLRQEFGNDAIIDIYEKTRIGGRIATRDFGDEAFEVGATIFHGTNQYMKHFTEKFGFELENADKDPTFGFYDKGQFTFLSSSWTFVTYLKLLWKYGFSLFKMEGFIDNTMLKSFIRIYNIQAEGRSFDNVHDLLEALNPEFAHYADITTEAGFLKYANVNEAAVRDFVKGALRVNYGQSTDVNFFLGSVAVAGMVGKLWEVKGGNQQIPQRLLKESRANLMDKRVQDIIENPNGTFHLEFIEPVDGTIKRMHAYDAVVVAAPLTHDFTERVAMNPRISVPGAYKRIVTTLVRGIANPAFFNVNQMPALVINNDMDDFFNCLAEKCGEKDSGEKVYKIFSPEPLTDVQIGSLFKNVTAFDSVDWLAYPRYGLERLKERSFILRKRLYYVNAIEWAASAMEMSIIGGKNVALLVKKELAREGGLQNQLNDPHVKVEL